MKEYCENPLCEAPAFIEVAVSVAKPSDRMRTLCATCKEAYTWGVQHGSMIALQEGLWILAVADRGIVAHVRAYPDETAAQRGLAAYLRKYHEYKGPNNAQTVRDWLETHDENLSVEIVHQEQLTPKLGESL